MKRITLRDIAAIANVSHFTVSLALRNHPKIPKETRERIQQIAKHMGYRPDPALSALLVYRRNAKPSAYQGTIAWINNHHDPEWLLQRAVYREYFIGARERAEEIGYKLEEFRLSELGMSFERLSKILKARSIQGLLFAPQERQKTHISRHIFDWDYFSSVAFGFTLKAPQLHLITNAQFSSTRLAVRKLRSLGYRRIGCVTNQKFEQRTDSNFLAGFIIEQRRFPESDQIPIISAPVKGDFDGEFRKWRDLYVPDAILDFTGYLLTLPAFAPSERKGCALALGSVAEDGSVGGVGEFAGIYQNDRIIGRAAIDTVVSMININERGIPSVPRRILINGRWMDGPSAPRITRQTE